MVWRSHPNINVVILIEKGRLIAYPFVIVATSQSCGSRQHPTGNIQENLKHRRII
jgi:hypothetical protein